MKHARKAVDLAMVLILPLLMAYSLVGETAHEALGLAAFALFLLHHVLNRKWWAALFQGKYTPARTLNTAVNLLLVIVMLAQPVSGILMSRHVLVGFTIPGTVSAARLVHLCLAWWGFLLMSFHLGLHLRPLLAKLPRRQETHGFQKASPQAFAAAAALYGLAAFVRRGLWQYLFLQSAFAFYDPGEPLLFYLLDMAAIMVLFAGAALGIQRFLTNHSRR